MVDSNSAVYDKACDNVHAYIVSATKDINPGNIKDARLVRKKVSVFTYGVCSALAEQASIDKDELYYRYLLKGGLTSHQARVVVERTSLEFIKKDYATGCFDAGYQNVMDNEPDNKINSQKLSELLADKFSS